MPIAVSRPHRYVAIGDSFTEGVGDDDADYPNGVRGWADRVAQCLAADDPTFRYANLAVRGRLAAPVFAEQTHAAVAMGADLVTVCAGVNDLLRPSVDIDALIEAFDDCAATVVSSGAAVLTFTLADPGGMSVFSALRGRFAIYNELLREVVDRRGLLLVDFWRDDAYRETRMWERDRMHLSTAGHQRMAGAVLDVLGISHALPIVDFPPAPALTSAQRRRANREWTAQHAAPWIVRRLRGVSRGDGLTAKYPEPTVPPPP
ncbi:SGNH/GDSL hydrolase family protein [Williamsia sterculiae]|uniref:SGNH/GDSL hydrolase family protein n=1 Tax=Williamsia sterculiae TaxID=1344003 RepID=UPI001F401684|nr:SGNH/GDSL hydrolase family protein [Williamsia sterculiae]